MNLPEQPPEEHPFTDVRFIIPLTGEQYESWRAGWENAVRYGWCWPFATPDPSGERDDVVAPVIA